MSNDSFIPKIKLVHPTDCTCSKADLREFGFCLCGATHPPSEFKQDDFEELLNDFFDLMIKPPYKP